MMRKDAPQHSLHPTATSPGSTHPPDQTAEQLAHAVGAGGQRPRGAWQSGPPGQQVTAAPQQQQPGFTSALNLLSPQREGTAVSSSSPTDPTPAPIPPAAQIAELTATVGQLSANFGQLLSEMQADRAERARAQRQGALQLPPPPDPGQNSPDAAQ